MFPKPTEILKHQEGTLAQTPLPFLLNAIALAERSCTLELVQRSLEKRIRFEDGAAVGCSSNLLHETLGRFLVSRGKLEEDQYQRALQESQQTGTRMGEILIKRGLLLPADLYKSLQANFAHKLLDCFRLGEAAYRLTPSVESSETPVRMNTAQIILTGSTTVLPYETVTQWLAVQPGQRYALCPRPPQTSSGLKLQPKETQLLEALKNKASVQELTAAGLEEEDVLRRLFALKVLGLVDSAEAVSELKAALPAAAPEPVAAPVAAAGATPKDDERLGPALLQEFMSHRGKDPFDLLGVDEKTQSGALRKAFLQAVDRLSPLRFAGDELREKAEALLVAYARAYTALADPEQHTLCVKRRRAASDKKKSDLPSAAEVFRINTDLLDAKSQFEDGKRRLAAGNPRAALEQFEYACDIEGKSIFRAYRAWARYQADPGSAAQSLTELAEASRADPGCEETHVFAAEISRALKQYAQAEECYRRAFRANPANRKNVDLAQEMSRLKAKR